MWHQLVLNGIGGRTIKEAKERMSYDEACSWAAYISRRGDLNPSKAIEYGFAMLAARMHPQAKAKMADFLFYWKPDEELATINDFMTVLQSSRKDR